MDVVAARQVSITTIHFASLHQLHARRKQHIIASILIVVVIVIIIVVAFLIQSKCTAASSNLASCVGDECDTRAIPGQLPQAQQQAEAAQRRAARSTHTSCSKHALLLTLHHVLLLTLHHVHLSLFLYDVCMRTVNKAIMNANHTVCRLYVLRWRRRYAKRVQYLPMISTWRCEY